MKRLVFASIVAAATMMVPMFGQQSEVGAREKNQQKRIAQGVKSGQITAKGAAKAEAHQAAVRNEIKTDRAANGGKMTAAERAKVNKQENKMSKGVYDRKHNAATQPGVPPK